MKFRPATIFTVFIAALILGALITAWEWPLRASILVLALGWLGLILGAIQLYLEVRPAASDKIAHSGMDIETNEEQKSAEANWRTIAIWAWICGLTLGIWFFGFIYAATLFVFSYAIIHGSRWYVALVLAAVSYGLMWSLFGKLMHVPWPEPYLMELLG